MNWKALSRQFGADWLELLFIIVVGPLIGLGMGYAAESSLLRSPPQSGSLVVTRQGQQGTFNDPPRVDSGVVDQEGSMTNNDLRSIIVPLVVTNGVGVLAVLIAVILGIALD